MKDSVQTGMNKTGIQMSPKLTEEMVNGNEMFPVPKIEDSSVTAKEMRTQYIKESGPLGTIPVPGTFKGAMNTAIQTLKMAHPEVLVDRLGQRLAFERSGVRLYDALILKCEATMPDLDLGLLREFRAEEALHFALVHDTMEQLGMDPTAQTPAADASAVSSMGLVQLVNDPRSTVQQCVEAILIAELTDCDGWELLIQMVDQAGLTDVAAQFRHAKLAEEKHLTHIRTWLEELTLKNKKVELQ